MTVTFAFVVVLTLFAAWQVGCIIGRYVTRPRRTRPAGRPWGALPARPQQYPPEPFTPSRSPRGGHLDRTRTEKVTHRAAA